MEATWLFPLCAVLLALAVAAWAASRIRRGVDDAIVAVDGLGAARRRLGALAVEGVFDFPKATGGGTAIGAGVNVYWNAGTGVATTTSAGNKLIGKTVRAAADADATVRVRLSQ